MGCCWVVPYPRQFQIASETMIPESQLERESQIQSKSRSQCKKIRHEPRYIQGSEKLTNSPVIKEIAKSTTRTKSFILRRATRKISFVNEGVVGKSNTHHILPVTFGISENQEIEVHRKQPDVPSSNERRHEWKIRRSAAERGCRFCRSLRNKS
jgi:hypothetical protein